MTGNSSDSPGQGADSAAPDSRPAALALTGLAVAFGVIGVSVGFATLLGIAATAAGGDAAGYGAMAVTAGTSLLLGCLLVLGAVLLWRAHRWSRIVTGVAVTLLTVSSLVRMVAEEVTFISVMGTVLSLLALTVMFALLVSAGVREHVRAGVPLRLR